MVALFKICRQDRFKDLYAHALRTVASICCVEEGISQLDKVKLTQTHSLNCSTYSTLNQGQTSWLLSFIYLLLHLRGSNINCK